MCEYDFGFDPPLSIVQHIFIQNNIINYAKSVHSFFENGVSFPQFIKIVFNIKNIPGLFQNPKTTDRKNENNYSALQFLLQNNETIRKINPKYETEKDQAQLLKLILIHQYYKIDIPSIIEKYNIIVSPLELSYTTEEDLFTVRCLKLILFVLNTRVPGYVIYYDLKRINDIYQSYQIKKYFNSISVPYLINKSCLDAENRDYFLIQLLIIFEFYSKTIGNIKKEKPNFIKEYKSIDFSDIDSDMQDQYYKNYKNIYEIVIYEKPKKIDNNLITQELQENSLLLTLNTIGKNGFNFHNLNEAITNDSLPKFVMHMLNIQSIENVRISNEDEQKNQTLTKNGIKNINETIKFLAKREIRFNNLKFNFQNHYFLKSSTSLFYSSLLNFFFIKESRQKMYERCITFLCTKIDLSKQDDFYYLTQFRIYPAILHIIINKNFNFKYDQLPKEMKSIKPYFQKAKIPMILGTDFLMDSNSFSIPNAIFYQLQFIYNKIDKKIPSFHVVELCLKAFQKIKKIKVPKLDLFIKSQKVKELSLKFQRERYNQCINLKDSTIDNLIYKKEKVKKIEFHESFKERQKTIDICKKESKKTSLKIQSLKEFWENDLQPIGYEDGIFINNKLDKKRKKLKKEWENAISEFSNMSNNENICQNPSRKKTKIYKIYEYDEEKNKWCYQSKNFDNFLRHNKINLRHDHSPIIFLFESKENDLISLTNYLGNISIPKFDDENLDKTEIFIYAVSGNLVSNENTTKSIKPIFLLLHVNNKSIEKDKIPYIVFKIYVFLSIISHINIIIFNKNYYRDQIEFIKIMNEIQESLLNRIQDDKNSSCSPILNMKLDPYNLTKGEEDVENEEDEEEEEECSDNIYEFNELKIYKKKYIKDMGKLQYIVLIDDQSIPIVEGIEFTFLKNKFFKNMKNEIMDSILDFCPKQSNSYIKVMYEFIPQLKIYSYYFNNLEFIDITEISDFYINLKFQQVKLDDELKEKIQKRFQQYESINNEKNSFYSLSMLRNELLSLTPSIDFEMIDFCDPILSDLRKKISSKKADFYKSELKISADLHLAYLEKIINDKNYWNQDQMVNISKSHEQFLKNEFIDIIKLSSDEKYYNLIYYDNYDICNEQIKNDTKIINKLFYTFQEKMKIKKQTKDKHIKQSEKNGAKYSIKETEKFKEIEVTVDVGKDLKSVIEQDF